MSRPRQFDWDKARRMRATGMTYVDIAAEMGVTLTAIARVCDPAIRNLMAMASTRYQRKGVCIDCGAQRSFNATHLREGISKGRCRECAAVVAATNVRDDGLRCIDCGDWKWDTSFPHAKQRPRRRGRHEQCTECNTKARREWRLRNPEKYAAATRRDSERRRAQRQAA